MATAALGPKPKGETLVKLARQHVGEKYVLGAFVPKDNPNWRGPWDCAEFASWLTYQVSSQLYGCERDHGDPSTADAFTGYWERDAKTLGEIVSIETSARTPGATVLRFPQPGATGHIVISKGNGETVEAHSSLDGVVELSLSQRRWDCGILIPWIDYNQSAPVSVEPVAETIYRLQTPLMHGPDVLHIQQLLKDAGFDPGSIDGEFGPHTHAATVAFQLREGLTPDGEVGPLTMAALLGK
jgi:hypothetical protein